MKKEFPNLGYQEDLLTQIAHLIYKLFGRYFFKKKAFHSFFYKNIYNKRYEQLLKKANMKLLPEEYFFSINFLIVFTILFIFLLSFFLLFINTFFAFTLFYGGIVVMSFMGIFLYNFPIVKSQARGKQIDAAIPYLLPYLKLLSKELNLSKIVAIIDDFLIYKEIQIEFRKIKYYSDVLGHDIHSSVREAMVSCPSRELSDLMNDLVSISISGGDIYLYLERKLDNLNVELEALEKKNIDTLLIFSQIYVVLLLIAPLFFTIMSSILNLVNFTGGVTAETSPFSTIVTTVFLLIMLPFVYAGFMMLVFYSKPLYARLKPTSEGS